MNHKLVRSLTHTLAIVASSYFTAQNVYADSYVQTNLVSDIQGLAPTTDTDLKNPWGLSFSATSPFWVSNQMSDTSTLYNGAGVKSALTVSVPSPTGTVYTGGSGFTAPGASAPASFVFDTLGGTIYAWNTGSTAQLAATATGAVYTGLALDNVGSSNYLYAANIAGNSIDVYNASFAKVSLAGSFKDPNLASGYSAYNVQTINGLLYVEYYNPNLPGAGNGVVSIFDANGNFVKEVASGGQLNIPWGVVIAPAGFGAFANDLLVGNFGNGEINAYDPSTGVWLGTLEDSTGKPIVNSGLWALATRTGTGFDTNGVYFDAGINRQADGLFGVLDVATPEPFSVGLSALGFVGVGLYSLRRRVLH